MITAGSNTDLSEVLEQQENVIGIYDSVAVEVCIGVGCVPYGNEVENIIHIDKAITCRITDAVWTGVGDLISTIVSPIPIDLIRAVSAEHTF